MKKIKSIALFSAALLAPLFSSTVIAIPDREVRWDALVGVIQTGNVVGSGTGAVTGAGQPWVVTGGRAEVDLSDGDLRFDVEGLVLAGGNSIGTRGTNAQVRGTLVCDTNGSAGGGNSVLVNTPLVALNAQGDAEFSGNVGPLPAVCTTEPDIAFLIRSTGGNWFAAGIVREP
ncbi:MAG TPA: hypothetical protein VKH64_04480 [Candidatus Binatia bacterium]|nr:hypothetical protein [Candidatus Binatia bacterium]